MTGFLTLIAGVALWWLAHLFKRIAPGRRAALGDMGKPVVAGALVAAIVLMVLGYRLADYTAVYFTPDWMKHVNNLLVLAGFYVFGIGMAKGALSQKLRHPMLLGTAIWAVAHLLVRGDLAALILFGGLGLWALVEIVVIDARTPGWRPPRRKSGPRDLVAIPIVLVTYAVVGVIHGWLGPWPFGGGGM